MTEKRLSFLDGLLKKNTVFISGLVIAPVVAAANTVSHALTLIFSFSAITFITLLASSFIPRKMVYSVRTILYSFIGSLVYIPVVFFTDKFFAAEQYNIGIFLPLFITNSLIISQSELRFFRQKKGAMLLDVIFYILGFDVAVIIIAFIREVFSTGQLGGKVLGIPLTIPALALPFGGFIVLGFLSALARKLSSFGGTDRKEREQ